VNILLDNCVHRQVGAFFPGHQVWTAHQAGLARLENGALLLEAAKQFDVIVTTDKNIKTQHNLSKLPIPVIELNVFDSRIEGLLPLAPFCPAALAATAHHWFVSIQRDGSLALQAPR
jgi:predicted nuclease of predicted toxin-antitoxin system